MESSGDKQKKHPDKQKKHAEKQKKHQEKQKKHQEKQKMHQEKQKKHEDKQKKHQQENTLSVKQRVFVKCGQHGPMWHEAIITDVHPKKGYKVHYVGWHSTWDEWRQADTISLTNPHEKHWQRALKGVGLASIVASFGV